MKKCLFGVHCRPSPFFPIYKNRDKIPKDPFFLFGDSADIGSGQTTVRYLGPGKTASFSMTIPNVKQTSDGIQIVVSFSGERYGY